MGSFGGQTVKRHFQFMAVCLRTIDFLCHFLLQKQAAAAFLSLLLAADSTAHDKI